jgi:hypothetical protein
VLVERDDVLAALRELVDDASTGAGRLVLVGGEAGVGKTTLAGALTAEARDGTVVRRGACDSLSTAEALGPLLDAAPEIADALADESTLSRPRLFRRIQDVLCQSPTLLVLDDVHWADEATLDLLRFVGRRIDRWPLTIVATFRADEVGPAHPLTVVMGDLVTVPGVVRMQLPPLTLDGVRRLVDEAGSQIDPAELHRRTGGNPFYVTEVLAAASEEVPGTIRDAVMARNSRLSGPARSVLGAAAVLAQRVDVDLVLDVSGQSVEAVDECLAHGVLVADGSTVGFRHELARLAVASTLSRADVIDLNARALAELQRRGSTDDRRLAYHAAGCGDRAAVAQYAPRAAEGPRVCGPIARRPSTTLSRCAGWTMPIRHGPICWNAVRTSATSPIRARRQSSAAPSFSSCTNGRGNLRALGGPSDGCPGCRGSLAGMRTASASLPVPCGRWSRSVPATNWPWPTAT